MRMMTQEDIDTDLRRAVRRRYFSLRSPLAYSGVMALSVVQMWVQRDNAWTVALHGAFIIGCTLWFGLMFFKLGYLVGAQDTINYIDNWEHEQ